MSAPTTTPRARCWTWSSTRAPATASRCWRCAIACACRRADHRMVPHWLHMLSIAGLALGVACSALIALDVRRHPQQMGIMDIVWPVTALFGTVLAAWGYLRWG